MIIKDGPITRFLKRRIPVLDMELWSALVALFCLLVTVKVWRSLGVIDWFVLFGVS